MKEFLLIYRNDYKAKSQPSPDEMQASMKKWQNWLGGIAAQNKLSHQGSPLTSAGKVVKANNVITDGPYTEIKELIGGYSIIKAESIEEAAELVHGCPELLEGGNVEVREIVVM